MTPLQVRDFGLVSIDPYGVSVFRPEVGQLLCDDIRLDLICQQLSKAGVVRVALVEELEDPLFGICDFEQRTVDSGRIAGHTVVDLLR